MVKKKIRDPEKKAALAAKKEAKQEKAARKRSIKDGGVGDGNSSDEDDDQSHNSDGGENLDRLLRQYKQQDMASSNGTNTSSKVVPCDGFPLARAHATVTLAASDGGTSKKNKNAAIFMFGGEYYDGAHTIVSDQLFKYEVATNQWKQIITTAAKSPPPRCSHAAAYYNKSLYIFGGEHSKSTSETAALQTSATSSSTKKKIAEYHHYKDLWKFDTESQQWSEIKPTVSSSSVPSGGGSLLLGATSSASTFFPSARSGMSMVIWKHYLIIFGGFMESAHNDHPRWYNDVYAMDLHSEQWIPIPHSRLSVRPEPRSSCRTALRTDSSEWFIHGGFSKLPNSKQPPPQQQASDDATAAFPVSETIVHTDSWILHLEPLLSNNPPTWERWTSSLSRSKRYESAQICHNGRSGVASIAYGNMMIMFGGVMDQELHHHKVESTFYNDISLFHIEKRKFIPIRTTIEDDDATAPNSSKGSTAARTQADTVNNEDEDDTGDVVSDLVQEPDENNKPTELCGWDLQKLRTSMFSFMDGDGNVIYEKIDSVKQRADNVTDSSSNKKDLYRHRTTEPLPRIKASLFMIGHTLYVYGGLLEVGDREVTLDDMWCIDLRKTRKWICIFTGTMHQQVWRGAVHDDDDSYYSANNNSNTAGGKDDDEELSDQEDDAAVEKAKAEVSSAATKTVPDQPPSISLKQRILDLVELHHLDDLNRSPQPDEDLHAFYKRTCAYWGNKFVEEQCTKGGRHSYGEDEIHAGGLACAQRRFKELEPVIALLIELKLQRKQEKAEKKKGSSKSN